MAVEVNHASNFSQRYLARASLAHVSHLGARLEAVAVLLAEFSRVPSFVASPGSALVVQNIASHLAMGTVKRFVY